MSVYTANGMVVASAVSAGNEHDGMVMALVLDGRAAVVVADKAFDIPRNQRLLREKEIDNRILRRGVDNGKLNRVAMWLSGRTR